MADVEIPLVAVHVNPFPVYAGETFTVAVRLADFVGAGDRVVLVINCKRILRLDEEVQLHPIVVGYFDPLNSPGVIILNHPDIEKESHPIRVKADATQPNGYLPVSFPEELLVTVSVSGALEKFSSQVIRINPV